jgi:hypothetical protein
MGKPLMIGVFCGIGGPSQEAERLRAGRWHVDNDVAAGASDSHRLIECVRFALEVLEDVGQADAVRGARRGRNSRDVSDEAMAMSTGLNVDHDIGGMEIGA